MAGNYDKALFKGATLQDLPVTPRFVFCATNLQTGVLWRFSKPYAGDYVVGYLEKPEISLAHAVRFAGVPAGTVATYSEAAAGQV